MFDNNDIILITTIVKKYKKYIEDCMKKTQEYKLIPDPKSDSEIIAVKNGKETRHAFIPIGFYDKNKNEFIYKNMININLLEHIQKYYNLNDIFGSDSTIKKLFSNIVEINSKDHLVIPCLISIMNPAFNVVKISLSDAKGKIMYALVKLNIECKFDYDNFLKEMSVNKFISDYSKLYDTKKKKPSKKIIKKKIKKI